ncbi:fungal-specific transcription factor domain-containing protein [Gautieria morchelliformis]|nr:fungal-specific transcription factor domain-containing protein [Gautieria morchelliformis]
MASAHISTAAPRAPSRFSVSRVDPHQEIARIRQALSLLESHIARSPSWLANGVSHHPQQQSQPQTTPSSIYAQPQPASAPLHTPVDHSPRSHLKQENIDPSLASHAKSSTTDLAPGMLAQPRTGDGGMYAGPTSAATHFASLKSDDDAADDDDDSQSVVSDSSPDNQYPSPRDFDLLAMLPEVSIVDGLLSHYFESCQWENRHLHHHAFTQAWARFKSNIASDRLVLATVFVVLAIAVQFLPPRHPLIESLPESPPELSENYYTIGCTALQRHQAERKTYSLELIELLLLRTHYLTITKDQCEDLWTMRGELVSTAIAMGLHRDPGKWKMSRDVAERRRWAWWNIMLTERWQAFMFGRPLAICNHHFDTQFPSAFDHSYDPTGRLHLPHIHLFRLAEALGDVMDDAVSVRPVPYERVIAQDKVLERWLQTLPPELDLDDYRLARALSSSVLSIRRTGAQSLCVRIFFHHVRFTLHRPYASPWKPSPSNHVHDARWQQSLETAISAADRLTQLVTQARPDFLANSSLAVPGHLHWGPFHAFSAAMFFSFQLIAKPDQPGANLFRANVKRVMVVLEHLRGIPVADKALSVLQALAPLYDEQPVQDHDERERKKSRVLSFVRRLAFPCHDSPGFSRARVVESSVSPNTIPMAASSSPSTSISPPSAHGMPPTPVVTPTNLPQQQQPQQQQQQPPQAAPPPQYAHSLPPPRPPAYEQAGPYGSHPEETVWGTSIGVDSGDWANFISVVQPRPDNNPSRDGQQLV